MKNNQFGKLVSFLDRLETAKITYQLRHSRDDAIMVLAYAPSEYWEIEFMEDGEIEIERYRSNGHIDDQSILDELFDLWAEPEPTTKAAVDHDDIIAGK